MIRRGAPIWLAAPTRLAGLSRRTARVILAAIACLLLLAVVAAPAGATLDDPLSPALIASMRHGGTFYDSLAVLLRGDGVARSYATTPPTLPLIASFLPDWAMLMLVALLVAALLWTGSSRLAMLFPSLAASTLAIALLATGCAAGVLLCLVAPPAGGAALLLALALLLQRPERSLDSVALGCIAAMIAPAAIALLLVLSPLASLDSSRRTALLWLIAAGAASAVLAAHWHAVSLLALPPLPDGEISRTVTDDTLARLTAAAFPGLSSSLGGPLLLLALLGWGAVAIPLGLRIVALIAAAVSLDAITPLGTAPLVAVLVAPGLAFVPEALADLIRAALDQRRFTVTRMTR